MYPGLKQQGLVHTVLSAGLLKFNYFQVFLVVSFSFSGPLSSLLLLER